jgi:hypothetical protein
LKKIANTKNLMPTFVIELNLFKCPMGKEMEAEGTQQHIQ